MRFRGNDEFLKVCASLFIVHYQLLSVLCIIDPDYAALHPGYSLATCHSSLATILCVIDAWPFPIRLQQLLA